MRNIFTLLLFLTVLTTHGQVQELRNLSQGNFIGSSIVYNDDRTDVYGYFLMYQFNQKSKDVYNFEYVLLDKNLNKITSGTFQEGVYSRFLGVTSVKLDFAKKFNDKIVFCMHDKVEDSNGLKILGLDGLGATGPFNFRYHTLNLDKFELSSEYVVKNNQRHERKFKKGDIVKKGQLEGTQLVYPTNGKGLVLFPVDIETLKPSFIRRSRSWKVDHYGSIKKFYYFDADMSKRWTANINQNKDKPGHYTYAASDPNVLVIRKENLAKKPESLENFVVYDSDSGKFIAEFANDDPKYRMLNFKIKFTPGKIILYNWIFRRKDHRYTMARKLGYAQVVLDKTTGKELKRNFVLWNAFKPHLEIKNKYGKIKGPYSWIFLEDFVPLENGETLAVAEAYKTGQNTSVYDLFMLKFDANFQLVYFHKIQKERTKYKGRMLSGYWLYNYGYFDYQYSQKLNNNGDYVFFYLDNQKEGWASTRQNHPDRFLGIVTYVDGEFQYSTLDMSHENYRMIPGKAKMGWILLQRISEDEGASIRLEKINY